jgi:hypothetical protein
MEYDTPGQTQRSTDRPLRTLGVIVVLLGSLVGVPVMVLAEIEFGLLTAFGVSGNLAFGLFVMIPGFALGALSLVVMLGT